VSAGRDRQPIGFAHRGARSELPDNSLPGFARALELGATGLESDAWVTADGVVVLDHDGVTGPLWRRRALSAQTAPELPAHILTLYRLYERCGTAFELSLDVKDPAALGPTLEVAHAHGAADRLWLCYHDWRLVAGWKRVAGQAHLVESTRRSWIPEGLAVRAATLRDSGIEAINLHRREWDRTGVSQVHAAGILAFAWDAQSSSDISALVALGVDGLYSDYVGRMMEVIAAASLWGEGEERRT
jgi:glycerophosphoryl diester phosphodiesterase